MIERYCKVCGTTRNIECHHVFYGTANRKQSEKYGMKMDLCNEDHTGTRGIHNNRQMDLHYKQEYQRKFELEHGHNKFMAVFGRNYLDEVIEGALEEMG